MWATYFLITYVLVLFGVILMPADESVLDENLENVVTIWVDKPNVKLAAVLDATVVLGNPDRIPLLLYADGSTEGFNWTIKATDPDSLMHLGEPTVSWKTQVRGHVIAGQTGYSYVASQIDMKRVSSGAAPPQAILYVKPHSFVLGQVGSRVHLSLPLLHFGLGERNLGPTADERHTPDGEVIVLAPLDIQWYRTEVVTPAFASPGVWRDSTRVFAYWTGTDPAAERREQRNIFLAGLSLGVAGAALIAGIDDLVHRFRQRRRRRQASA